MIFGSNEYAAVEFSGIQTIQSAVVIIITRTFNVLRPATQFNVLRPATQFNVLVD